MAKTSASRLKVKQGRLSFCYPTLPDLGCLMQDLDENGCSGTVLFEYLSEDVAAAWRKILVPRRPLRIKLDVAPWLNEFNADGLVVDIQNEGSRCVVNVRFNQLQAEARLELHHAVMTMAMQKIRRESQGAPPAGMQPVPVPQTQSTGLNKPPPLSITQTAVPAPAPAPRPAAAAAPARTLANPRPLPLTSVPPRSTAVPGDAPILLKLKKIGEVLLHMGQLSSRELDVALQHARANHERLGRYLVRSGIVKPDVLCRALALQSGLPMTDLSDVNVPESLLKPFGSAIILKHSFVPFDESKAFICIAAPAPLKGSVLQELEKQCGKKIEVFLAQEEQVVKFLESLQLKQPRKSRKFVRYTVALPVRYQFCSRLGTAMEAAEYSGSTQNISEGGMLVEGTRSTLGSPEDLRRRGVCVRITLNPNQPREIKAVCQLRAVREKERKQSEDPNWLLGLEFVDITSEHRRHLKELCVMAVMNIPHQP